MKLKRLIVAEISTIAIVFVLLIVVVSITSYLGSSNPNSKIGLYTERKYAEGEITVEPGETTKVEFVYTSYEPAILVLELTFQSWNSTGYIIVRCNNRPLAPILASPTDPFVKLGIVTVSGAEWVEPLSSMFGLNELTFESANDNGFEGRLSYQVKLRGSR